mmetsp:Transcript_13596/g.33431  ORF Transcript_13596/g.33431 Transcript_13596/m.33431 type:complete len:756 (+) Transcript_13596:2177-4444(+)
MPENRRHREGAREGEASDRRARRGAGRRGSSGGARERLRNGKRGRAGQRRAGQRRGRGRRGEAGGEGNCAEAGAPGADRLDADRRRARGRGVRDAGAQHDRRARHGHDGGRDGAAESRAADRVPESGERPERLGTARGGGNGRLRVAGAEEHGGAELPARRSLRRRRVELRAAAGRGGRGLLRPGDQLERSVHLYDTGERRGQQLRGHGLGGSQAGKERRANGGKRNGDGGVERERRRGGRGGGRGVCGGGRGERGFTAAAAVRVEPAAGPAAGVPRQERERARAGEAGPGAVLHRHGGARPAGAFGGPEVRGGARRGGEGEPRAAADRAAAGDGVLGADEEPGGRGRQSAGPAERVQLPGAEAGGGGVAAHAHDRAAAGRGVAGTRVPGAAVRQHERAGFLHERGQVLAAGDGPQLSDQLLRGRGAVRHGRRSGRDERWREEEAERGRTEGAGGQQGDPRPGVHPVRAHHEHAQKNANRAAADAVHRPPESLQRQVRQVPRSEEGGDVAHQGEGGADPVNFEGAADCGAGRRAGAAREGGAGLRFGRGREGGLRREVGLARGEGEEGCGGEGSGGKGREQDERRGTARTAANDGRAAEDQQGPDAAGAGRGPRALDGRGAGRKVDRTAAAAVLRVRAAVRGVGGGAGGVQGATADGAGEAAARGAGADDKLRGETDRAGRRKTPGGLALLLAGNLLDPAVPSAAAERGRPGDQRIHSRRNYGSESARAGSGSRHGRIRGKGSHPRKDSGGARPA